MSFPLYWATLSLSFLLLIPLICSMEVLPDILDVQGLVGDTLYCFQITTIPDYDSRDQGYDVDLDFDPPAYAPDYPLRTSAVFAEWLGYGVTGKVKVWVYDDGWYSYNDYCCEDGKFNEYLSPECQDCGEGCAYCEDAEECQKCKDGYVLDGKTCKVCPNGICECPAKCSSCKEGTTACEGCAKGYYSENSDCVKCPFACEECENSLKCTKCDSTSMVVNNLCYTCGTGSYFDSYFGKCTSCSSNCVQCINNVTCTQCTSRFALNATSECETPTPPWKKFTSEYVALVAIAGVVVLSVFILVVSFGLHQLFSWKKKEVHETSSRRKDFKCSRP